MIVTGFRQLVALSKPRIIAMLVLTALAGVVKASDGVPAILHTPTRFSLRPPRPLWC